ncbi:hypothetical protein [Aureimonas sp. ME7]|uniref:hypothetical protein n=1 Tax=Aureimonas sp. ME7 TaxID=2744252 RepID=UPI0015F4D3EF|nr:hypothetical protein [Aureimonas sp. ME7]
MNESPRTAYDIRADILNADIDHCLCLLGLDAVVQHAKVHEGSDGLASIPSVESYELVDAETGSQKEKDRSHGMSLQLRAVVAVRPREGP